jgi:photosystem II stability/assembly factor-like uncharacterized protein
MTCEEVEIEGFDGQLFGVWGNEQNIIVVGDEYISPKASTAMGTLGGVILSSSDGGATWKRVALPPTKKISPRLFAVWGVSPSSIFAVGEAGTILHSLDGGMNWRQEKSPTPAWLYDVWGASEEVVYAVGGSSYGFGEDSHEQPQGAERATILRSIDAGKTWSRVTLPQAQPPESAFMSVFGVSSDVFAGEMSGVLARSKDAGKTWSLQKLDAGVFGVWGDDKRRLAVGFEGEKISRSADGERWSRSQTPAGRYAWLRGVFGFSNGEIFIVGEGVNEAKRSTFLHSFDAGETWRYETLNSDESLFGLWGSDPAHLYLVGEGGLFRCLVAQEETR